MLGSIATQFCSALIRESIVETDVDPRIDSVLERIGEPFVRESWLRGSRLQTCHGAEAGRPWAIVVATTKTIKAGIVEEVRRVGVRVWFYLEDRERTLDSPTDKIMLSLTAFPAA